MTVELLRDTIVKFPQGTVLEVSEEEGKRLMAFNNAKPVEKSAPKKAAKKKEA